MHSSSHDSICSLLYLETNGISLLDKLPHAGATPLSTRLHLYMVGTVRKESTVGLHSFRSCSTFSRMDSVYSQTRYAILSSCLYTYALLILTTAWAIVGNCECDVMLPRRFHSVTAFTPTSPWYRDEAAVVVAFRPSCMNFID
jgi:hypothetical protein